MLPNLVVTAPPPLSLSVEAQADQLHAAIVEAHMIIDGIIGSPPTPAEEKPFGARAQLEHCGSDMHTLIVRLQALAELTGRLI